MNEVGPIAYLTGEYPRATDTFIQREVAALRALGLQVETCSIRRTDPSHHVGPEQRAEAERTFHVLEAAKNPMRLLGAHVGLFAQNPKRYFGALKQAWDTRAPGGKAALYQMIYFAEAGMLARHMQSCGITHLHNHIAAASCTVAMLASTLSGIPYSFTLHGPDIFFEPHRWRLDAKIASARFVACISHFCRAQAMNFSECAHWSKLHIVHCGIEPERYTPRARTRGKEVLFIGRLAGVKGVPVLLDALRALQKDHSDLRLTFIGDGPERAMLEARAKEMGLADITDFTGYKSQAEVATALKTTDIFVLPSFAEGVPVVLMEAMAAEVPVVTTHVAGIPELIEHGVHGLLTPPGDSASLANAIALLLSDPNSAARMGKAGREKVSAEFNIALEGAWLAEILAHYHKSPTPDLPVRRTT
ncbi:glycosyltransferase [Planktotalea arctica]|uniref:glycosyltransferase n=1 Tax=Planktotalea arctica TaxID=1481893 RepID=UPI000A16F485|nr:glycosyltransferase [Planktotalea arctica]